jgi:hypothetical protein
VEAGPRRRQRQFDVWSDQVRRRLRKDCDGGECSDKEVVRIPRRRVRDVRSVVDADGLHGQREVSDSRGDQRFAALYVIAQRLSARPNGSWMEYCC